MNPLPINSALRELPEYLIENYLNGRASQVETRIVESLMNLPENSEKIRFARENPLPPIDETRIQRLMKNAAASYVPAIEKSTTVEANSADIRPAAGQIWSINQFLNGAPGKEYLPIAQIQYVFILTNPAPLSEVLEKEMNSLQMYIDDEFVEYLPVSMHTEFADQHDLIIPPGNSILGVEFMIQTEINSTTLCKNLDSYFGTLNEEEIAKLLNLYFYTHKMGHDSELLEMTNLGTDRYEKDSYIVQYKKIEFKNSQIISEPVDGMIEYLEGLEQVKIINAKKADLHKQHYSAAAASTQFNIAKLLPESSKILHQDENILLAVNYYGESGYYFNVVVAPEVCPGSFKFTVSNQSGGIKALVFPENKPGEHFFSFYQEFLSGVYDALIETESGVLLSTQFILNLQAE